MKKKIIAIMTVLILGIAAFFIFRPESEADRVKEVLFTLCRMGSKKQGDNAAAAALMISKTDKIFADKFRIKISDGMFDGEFDPSRMTSELARYRAVFRDVKVSVQDFEVSFPAENTAVVICSGVLNGDMKNGKAVSEARDIECHLVKSAGNWKITELVIRDILEK